jgi:hypothetical protein
MLVEIMIFDHQGIRGKEAEAEAKPDICSDRKTAGAAREVPEARIYERRLEYASWKTEAKCRDRCPHP